MESDADPVAAVRAFTRFYTAQLQVLREGLLDELHLLVFPVVLGRGKRLFGHEGGQVGLGLAASEAFPTGVVHLSYQPASR